MFFLSLWWQEGTALSFTCTFTLLLVHEIILQPHLNTVVPGLNFPSISDHFCNSLDDNIYAAKNSQRIMESNHLIKSIDLCYYIFNLIVYVCKKGEEQLFSFLKS